MGFLVPTSLSSPILPPASGANSPGKEKRNRFLRCPFFTTSAPPCFKTSLEGHRARRGSAGRLERTPLEKATCLRRRRCPVSSLGGARPPSAVFLAEDGGRPIFFGEGSMRETAVGKMAFPLLVYGPQVVFHGP